MKELKLMASDDTLYTVLDNLEEYLREKNCPQAMITSMLIATEEIYVNIAHYAYGGKEGEAQVAMEVTSDPKKLRLVFRDRGTPYNPLEKEDPDISLPAEERPIGGLGIFMVKEIMDSVEYEFKDGQNILTMEKNIQ